MKKDQLPSLKADLEWFIHGMYSKFDLKADDLKIDVSVRVEPDLDHIVITFVQT